MAAKFKKAKRVNRELFQHNSLITRQQAVRLIAQEVRLDGEAERLTRNRVSKRLADHIRTGKIAPPGSKGFRFGKLVAWARGIWPGKFVGWPATITASADLHAQWSILADGVGQVSLPTDLADCQRLAASLIAKNNELQRENAALRDDVEQLRPFKERDQRKRRLGSEAGKRARGIPKNREK